MNNLRTRLAKYNLSEKKIYLFCFLIAFLPRLVFMPLVYPLNISVDEFSMFLPIAKLLGWDWSAMILKPLYYGYGFIFLLTPLVKLIEDPIVLYRIIVFLMMLAQALVAPIVCYVVKRFFHCNGIAFRILIASICAYLVPVRALYLYNEFVYMLLMWGILIAFLLLQESQGNRKKKRWYSVLLALLMCYALSLHARAAALFIALVIVAVLYYYLYRKHLLSYTFFGAVCALGGVADFVIKNKLLHVVYNQAADTVSNTSVSFSLENITASAKALTGWFDILLGQINSMLITTGGIAILAVMIGCIVVWKTVIRDKALRSCTEETHVPGYVVTFVFFLAATGITIVGQSFSWLPGVTNALETGMHNDGLRALTYVRYYGAYFGPVMLAGLCCAYQYRDKVKKLLKPMILIVVLLQVLWVTCVVPVIVGFGECSFDSAVYSFANGWTDDITFLSYLPAVIATVLITVLFCWFFRKSRVNLAFGILLLVLMYGYCYQAVNYEGYRSVTVYQSVDKSYELLSDMKKEGILPETIYTQNSDAKVIGHSTGSILQFLFKENTIIPEQPGADVEEGIFLTGEFYEYADLIRCGYRCAQLDEEEFVYVKGEKLEKFIEQQGISLNECLEYNTTVDLDRFSSVYADHRTRTQIQSDGTEGYLFYDYRFYYGGGMFTTDMQLELKDKRTDLVGTFELVRDNGRDAFYGQDIYAEDFDENGNLSLRIPVNCGGNEILEPRLTIYEGNVVKVNSIRVEKSADYDIGAGTPNEASQIKEQLDALTDVEQVYYIDNSGTCRAITAYLEQVLGRKVDVLSLEALEAIDYSLHNCVLLTEDDHTVYEIVQQYPIFARTKGFTLLTSNTDMLNDSIYEGNLLSGEDGIALSYFLSEDGSEYDSDRTFVLTGGTYEITASFMAGDDGKPANKTMTVKEYGETIAYCEFAPDQHTAGKYMATAEIRNEEGFGEAQVTFVYSTGGAVYTPKVYIRKIG